MAIVRSQDAASFATFGYNYQVFLSFRGTDTRKTFTGHLYTALNQAGFRTFIDNEEIERGKRLELELRKAIQESRILIIVFSKDFASSEWCLNEVVMILEWSRSSSSHEVLPVFYDVRISDVKSQTGSIGEAFARYEELINGETDDEKKTELMEKVKTWKLALTEVAGLTAMSLKNDANGHEAKFIQEIVKEVERKLNRAILYVGRHLVGMDSRVENIDSWVQSSSSSEDILVICGMGGIGKTTIAKFVYNLNFQRFEGNCFLASVKEKSQQPNGLVNLQAQFISSILKGKRKEIYDVDEGIIKINDAISCKRILVVIDDVDEMEHLDALLGTREFYPGSKLIITTRNKSLLKPHEVHRLHLVPILDFYESMELFCWHAFGNEHPIEDYLELSKRAIYHCRGLPLAHKILGSSLAGKSKKVWASTLEKLEAIPETKILNVLKISFDSLQDDHDKNLFLHIACFFVGHKKDEIVETLDACDFFTVCGIENLVDRCLISIDEDCKLMMHQLLQKMGKQIVDQESPKDPGRRSRLWRLKDCFKVLKEKKGTETIEGLMLDMHNFMSSESSGEVDFNYDTFSRMDRLRFLKLNYARICGCPGNFAEGLRWLCWHGFPSKYIPFDLPLGNLVSLDMSYSKLEHIWVGNKVLLSLKILNLSNSLWLLETPNFNELPNLERLILVGCVSLFEVSDTIGNLERLVLLDLANCKSLRKFPNIGMLKLLQILVLDGCSNIGEFPKNLKNMESLKALNAGGATINPLTSSDRDHVKPILKNPQHICVSLPRFLVHLSFPNCNLLDDYFPLDFSNLSMLKELDLSYNLFHNLPQCIGSLRKLSKLNLVACRELHSISGLPEVETLVVDGCRSLESVTYQSALTRPSIYSFDCGKLKEVQGMFKLESMEKVNKEMLDNLGLCGVDLFGKLRLSFTFWSNSSRKSFAIAEIEEFIYQGLYEFGIFSTFLRRDEIQRWYSNINFNNNNKGSSSSISFVVPSYPNLRIQGLSVYSLYSLLTNQVPETDEIVTPYLLFAKINNKTKDFKWIYNPVTIAITKKENNEEEFVWLSHWKFGNHLESGDVIDVSVISGSKALKVKEFGINLVWGEEEEDMKSNSHYNDNTREVISGDLSNYQFMSSRTFFLCHHYIHYYFTDAWARKSWFRQVFGDHATAKDYNRWIWGKQNRPRLC